METLLESKLICHLYEELIDHTTSEWTTVNGVNGRKFTSKTDSSKYIFLPAGGSWGNTYLNGVGSDGNYLSTMWISSSSAWYVYFNSNGVSLSGFFGRYYGYPIRFSLIYSDQIFKNRRLLGRYSS